MPLKINQSANSPWIGKPCLSISSMMFADLYTNLTKVIGARGAGAESRSLSPGVTCRIGFRGTAGGGVTGG
jgi:hypothetical protein